MVSDEYVQIEVGWNDDGLFVAITHRITGRRLVARLEVGHGVADTQARLACEVVAEFFIPDDYLFETGRRGADGQIGTFTRVVHQPSGRSRMMNSLTSTDTRPLHLLDALVEELWHAGLLTGTYKHAEQGTTAGGERMSNQSD